MYITTAEGYGSADWAIPVELDDFPAKTPTQENYAKEFGKYFKCFESDFNKFTDKANI